MPGRPRRGSAHKLTELPRVKPARQQLIGLLLAAFALLPGPVPAQQDLRIGYVDMKRLLDEAPQVREAHDRLQAEFAERDRELQKDQSRLDALEAALAADRERLDEATLAERKREVDVLAGSMRRARERLQAELRERSAQELDRSWQAVSNAAVEYARAHGFDLLLPSPVIYASPKIDLTDDILRELRRAEGRARLP